MTNLIDITNFTGQFYLTVNNREPDKILTPLIASRQKQYLIDLMGVEMYNDFNADFPAGSVTPNTPKYQRLLDGVSQYTGYNGYIWNYDGLRAFLVPFLYSELIKFDYIHTQTGLVKQRNKNSEQKNQVNLTMLSANAWNEGQMYYREAYWYMYSNTDVYTINFQDYHKRQPKKGAYTKSTVR